MKYVALYNFGVLLLFTIAIMFGMYIFQTPMVLWAYLLAMFCLANYTDGDRDGG